MKLRKIITAVIFILIILSLNACNIGGNNEQNNSDTLNIKENTDSIENTENQSETVKDDNDYTAKYVCPMHCQGSGSDEAGNCPVCGMELIENLDFEE